VGVLEPRGEPDLPLKPLGAERRGEVGVEHLERDVAVVLEVAGEVDGGHSAPAEHALQQVSVAERIGERIGDVGHREIWLGNARNLPQPAAGRQPRSTGSGLT